MLKVKSRSNWIIPLHSERCWSASPPLLILLRYNRLYCNTSKSSLRWFWSCQKCTRDAFLFVPVKWVLVLPSSPYLIRVLVMQCKTSKIHSYLSKNRWVWFSNIRSNGNWPKNLETKPSAYFSNRFCKCPRMYIIYIVNIILIWIQTVHILYINIQTVVKTRVYPIKNYKSDQVRLPNTKTSNAAQNPNIMLQC